MTRSRCLHIGFSRATSSGQSQEVEDCHIGNFKAPCPVFDTIADYLLKAVVRADKYQSVLFEDSL